MKKALLIAMAAAFTIAVSGQALAGDPVKGKKVANKCKSCHDFTDKKKNKVGPYMWAIVGKPAGQVPGYKFSKAHMKKAADIVWDAATMDKYLENPRKMIPGNKMAFAGLKKAEDRANLIAYMATLK